MFRNFNVRKSVLSICVAVVALSAFVDFAQATKGFNTFYNFCQQANCADGAYPSGALLAKGNSGYGTTYSGGVYGQGTVFVVSNDKETVLWSFGGEYDGAYPTSNLIMDKSGNFWGTTSGGGNTVCGTSGCGTVFLLQANGQEYDWYPFCQESNCADGSDPLGGLVMDSKGNLYGTTYAGGANDYGTVFLLTTGEYDVETVLYSFSGNDGANPAAGLLRDTKGNLYGTTSGGGTGTDGSGTVFELTPPAKGHTTWTETVLYNFCSQQNCVDGANPYGPLVEDSDGNLYGTTTYGGSSSCAFGCGTVFKLTPKGKEKVLYTFCTSGSCSDGSFPTAGLLLDSGTLYGTTELGGPNNDGTVFSVSSSGTEKVLHAFNGGDGTIPQGNLILHSGYLVGTAYSGGTYGSGDLFRVGTKGGDAR